MAELIFEIGYEEIPARFVVPTIKQITELAQTKFIEAQLLTSKQIDFIKSYGTSRRLTLIAKGLTTIQSKKQKQILGPSLKAAYDKNGNPTKATIGFITHHKINLNQLLTFSNDKSTRIGYIKINKRRLAKEILIELLPQLVQTLHFPKVMRWGTEKLYFARPIHWFLALLDGQIIPFKLAGIQSNNKTYGHHFLTPKSYTINNVNDYFYQLKLAQVIINRIDRTKLIKQKMLAIMKTSKERLIKSTWEERTLIKDLLEEVTDLVELPVPCRGSFESEFLKLPRAVLISAMREHQRYFPLEDMTGNLLTSFIAINNTQVQNINTVIQGHERVLKARLTDAHFFFKKDIKKPLITRLKNLKKVTYYTKLGTNFDKVKRLIILSSKLTKKIAPNLHKEVLRTALLAKCDLVTDMVGEFPSLQGKIGEDYAYYDNENPAVCQAIREHYKPISAHDTIPKGLIGSIIGIADRLDLICGFFGIGEIPTSTTDPYALRRAAIAIIRIISEKGLKISLEPTLDQTLTSLTYWLKQPALKVKTEVTKFFAKRIGSFLSQQGVSSDIINAVLNTGLNDFATIINRALALTETKKMPDFIKLIGGLKRVINILYKASKQIPTSDPNEKLFQTQAEHELFSTVKSLILKNENLFTQKEYFSYLQKLSTLKIPIDNFFNNVMVMTDNIIIRHNRLALLNKVASIFNKIAQFNKLQLI